MEAYKNESVPDPALLERGGAYGVGQPGLGGGGVCGAHW